MCLGDFVMLCLQMEKSLQTFYTAGQMSHRSGDHRVPNHCHSHSWTVENVGDMIQYYYFLYL